MAISPGYYGPPPTGEALERLKERAEREWAGPALIEENGYIVIEVPSPYRVNEFKIELQRYNFQWNPERCTWRRRTTPGKELIALRWARQLFVETFGYSLPPMTEVTGPLTERRLGPVEGQRGGQL